MPQEMTLARAAQQALDVQSACNLSGVLMSFTEIVLVMRRVYHFDSDMIRTHPICMLFADKVADLCGTPSFAGSADDFDRYHKAAEACRLLAAETTGYAGVSEVVS